MLVSNSQIQYLSNSTKINANAEMAIPATLRSSRVCIWPNQKQCIFVESRSQKSSPKRGENYIHQNHQEEIYLFYTTTKNMRIYSAPEGEKKYISSHQYIWPPEGYDENIVDPTKAMLKRNLTAHVNISDPKKARMRKYLTQRQKSKE